MTATDTPIAPISLQMILVPFSRLHCNSLKVSLGGRHCISESVEYILEMCSLLFVRLREGAMKYCDF